MSPQPPEHLVPRASTPELRVERRGWLSYGLAALAISALGLTAGAWMPLATGAETTSGAVGVTTASPQSLEAPPLVPGRAAFPARGDDAIAAKITAAGALSAFVPRQSPADAAADPVRAAVVKERAAQRAEDLSKSAEDATRQTRSATRQVRDQTLDRVDRDTRRAAIQIAAERRQRALATRLAAEAARRAAQAAAASAAAAEQAAEQAAADQAAAEPTQPSEPSAPVPDDAPTSNGQGYSPVPGAVVGSPFGATGLWARYHTGLDFRAAQGTPIRAVKAGVVVFAGNSGNWAGQHVAIEHEGGATTMSSHMSSMAVQAGQTVRAGQVIGRVGATGRAFGAHLHFEVYPSGVRYGDVYRAINPVPWLRANGVRTR